MFKKSKDKDKDKDSNLMDRLVGRRNPRDGFLTEPELRHHPEEDDEQR